MPPQCLGGREYATGQKNQLQETDLLVEIHVQSVTGKSRHDDKGRESDDRPLKAVEYCQFGGRVIVYVVDVFRFTHFLTMARSLQGGQVVFLPVCKH